MSAYGALFFMYNIFYKLKISIPFDTRNRSVERRPCSKVHYYNKSLEVIFYERNR